MADIAEVTKLRPLPLLRGLVLADCPISESDDYRLEVITYLCVCVQHTHSLPSLPPGQMLVALPKLERLDKEQFTEDERADAEEVHEMIVFL